MGKAASCGDNTVKIHELHDLKGKNFVHLIYNFFVESKITIGFCLDTYNVINIDDERGLDNVEWSEDGQLLAVSTSKGIYFVLKVSQLFVYLSIFIIFPIYIL